MRNLFRRMSVLWVRRRTATVKVARTANEVQASYRRLAVHRIVFGYQYWEASGQRLQVRCYLTVGRATSRAVRFCDREKKNYRDSMLWLIASLACNKRCKKRTRLGRAIDQSCVVHYELSVLHRWESPNFIVDIFVREHCVTDDPSQWQIGTEDRSRRCSNSCVEINFKRHWGRKLYPIIQVSPWRHSTK